MITATDIIHLLSKYSTIDLTSEMEMGIIEIAFLTNSTIL